MSVQLLFACCLLCCYVCGCLRPRSRVPVLLPRVACASVENGNGLGSGTFTHRCVLPCWLGVIKDLHVSFCPEPHIPPAVFSKIHCRELYPQATENKSSTCGLRALLTKAGKLPECCLWSTPSVRTPGVAVSLASFLATCEHQTLLRKEGGRVVEHDHTCQDKCYFMTLNSDILGEGGDTCVCVYFAFHLTL